jgi:hypothetical protein
MNTFFPSLSAFALSISAVGAIAQATIAQQAPTVPQQKITTKKICSFDSVQDLLPPLHSEQKNSPLSYLAQQGFVQTSDGSWVCYVRDKDKQSRYYTLFKVEQKDGKLLASSFLQGGDLMTGQDERTLDLFIKLIENHTNTSQVSRQSIYRYLDSFISLVEQNKIPVSSRGYLFDPSNRGFVLYHPLTQGAVQGTAITINLNNLNSPKKLSVSPQVSID